MTKLSDEEKTRELMTVHNKVKELTGYDMFLFRPPYGDYNNEVVTMPVKITITPSSGILTPWTGKITVLTTLSNGLQKARISATAVSFSATTAPNTPKSLDAVLTTLQDKGYEFVPISQLIYRENYHMNHEGRQPG